MNGWLYWKRLRFLFGPIFRLCFLPAKKCCRKQRNSWQLGVKWWWWWWWGLFSSAFNPPPPTVHYLLQSFSLCETSSRCTKRFQTENQADIGKVWHPAGRRTTLLHFIVSLCVGAHGWQNSLSHERLSHQSCSRRRLAACWTNARPMTTSRPLSSLRFSSAAHTQRSANYRLSTAQISFHSQYTALKLESYVCVLCYFAPFFFFFTYESKTQSSKWQIKRNLHVCTTNRGKSF